MALKPVMEVQDVVKRLNQSNLTMYKRSSKAVAMWKRNRNVLGRTELDRKDGSHGSCRSVICLCVKWPLNLNGEQVGLRSRVRGSEVRRAGSCISQVDNKVGIKRVEVVVMVGGASRWDDERRTGQGSLNSVQSSIVRAWLQ